MKNSSIIFRQLLVASVFLLLFACKKGLEETQADPLGRTNAQKNASLLTVPPDVYVAGTIGFTQAAYWKNGVAVNLTGGEVATGIAVAGTDVYVCGYRQDANGMFIAQYWKNGVLTELSDGSIDVLPHGITISGIDVYISASEGRYVSTALYWKNGVRTTLGSGVAGKLFVAANGDVYVPNRNTIAYWKNGVSVTLASPSPVSGPSVNAVIAIGSVVYAVGRNGAGSWETPLYWKNGVLQTLMAGYTYNEAEDIAISNTGQEFISGRAGASWGNQQVGYWNGLTTDFDKWGTQIFSGIPRIALDGSDIYICGAESTSSTPTRAIYWKNGNPTYLTGATVTSVAYDITLGW